jgi:pyruvate dehydrogenase kinase 2/3/4
MALRPLSSLKRVYAIPLRPEAQPVTLKSRQVRGASSPTPTAPQWRPSAALDEWCQRDARPISLRQLTFFGRTLTEARLISSANYVRTELPTRIAHRLRDMQTLPYVVVTNPHLAHVYELYYRAFERFRKVPEVRTIGDNERFCEVVKEMLKEHLTVIPRLATGVLEIQGLMKPDATDKFMTTMLRSVSIDLILRRLLD